uniref:Uncharacterized protein n=1 Tax=Anguilla anguilla TaxID=7936 RepID=A0A0E9T6F8_ANGAN
MLTINFVSTVTRTDHGSVLLDTDYFGKGIPIPPASLFHVFVLKTLQILSDVSNAKNEKTVIPK